MKKSFAIVIAALLVCFALSAQTAPRSYYVSPIGNDANDGRTPDTAFKTLKKAFQQTGTGVIKTITVLGRNVTGDNSSSTGIIDFDTGTTEILLTGGTITYLNFFKNARVKFVNITIDEIRIGGTVTVSTGCEFGALAHSGGTLRVEDNAHIKSLGTGQSDQGISVVTITDNAVVNGIGNEGGRVTMQGNSTVTGGGVMNFGELILKEHASVTKCGSTHGCLTPPPLENAQHPMSPTGGTEKRP